MRLIAPPEPRSGKEALVVNAVAPGPIFTDRIEALPEERRVPIVAEVPIGRVGRAEEVTSTVVWLCSEAAASVMGVILTAVFSEERRKNGTTRSRG
jgi:acetoacetyl-CoA reductase